jgi:hypothetical protein
MTPIQAVTTNDTAAARERAIALLAQLGMRHETGSVTPIGPQRASAIVDALAALFAPLS